MGGYLLSCCVSMREEEKMEKVVNRVSNEKQNIYHNVVTQRPQCSRPLGLRLLGIGRNQYIDLMNQCRSSKVRARIEISDGENFEISPASRWSPTLFSHLCTSKEILPQEVRTGPAPRQTGGDLGGAVVGGADGLHHGGRHPGKRRGGVCV